MSRAAHGIGERGLDLGLFVDDDEKFAPVPFLENPAFAAFRHGEAFAA
jgi:hypothetical protein